MTAATDHTSKHLLKYYNVFAFYSSLIVWFGLHWVLTETFWAQSFFASVLLLGNTYSFLHLQSLSDRGSFQQSLFFLFQTFCFVGMSLELHNIAPMYFVFFPCSIMTLVPENKEHKKKGVALLFIALGGYFVTASLFDNLALGTLNEINGVIFMAFGFNALGTLYYMATKEHRSFWSRLLSDREVEEVKSKKDRLFYHDVINQTHGINLFLGNKRVEGKGLMHEEVMVISKEIHILQSLIKDHFDLQHKNLTNKFSSLASFQEFKESLEALVSTYLGEHQVKYTINYAGDLVNTLDGPDICRVHFSSFFRIITNLVKNIAENNSEFASFLFDYDKDGLKILVQNRINQDKSKEEYYLQKLRNVIMFPERNENSKIVSGVGLESISYLCDQLGGSVTFAVENDMWITEVFLPVDESVEEKRQEFKVA